MPSTNTPSPTSSFLWAAIPLAFAALLALLTFLYQPSLGGPYVFDSLGHLANNQRLDHFPPQLTWWRAETRPLMMATFSLERALLGNSPAIHRFGNLLIFAIATSLLFELIRRTAVVTNVKSSPDDGERAEALSRPAAILAATVALLWAVHPLNTQAIAYVIQRGESMMALFYFAFLLCLVRHHQTDRCRWLCFGAICFVLGLWSKTVMITALAVGPLFDRAFLSDSWKAVFRKRGWLYLPPLVASTIAVATLLPGIMRGEANVGFGGDAPPLMPYLAGQADVLFRYLSLTLFPIGLNIDHGLVAPDPWQQNLPHMLSVAAIVLGVIAAAWTDRWKLTFFIASPLLILAPTSSIVPTADLMVEHRMVLPLACLLTAIVFGIDHLAGRWLDHSAKPAADPASTGPGARRLASRLHIVLAICLPFFILLSVATRLRAADYASGSRLWADSLFQNPTNPRAAQNLANTAGEELSPEQLLAFYGRAFTIAQSRGLSTAVVLGRIGEELLKAGRLEEATKALQTAIDQDPPVQTTFPKAQSDGPFISPSQRQEIASHHVNLALAYSGQGNPDAAIEQLETAFRIHDQSPDARAIAGDLLARQNRPKEAIPHFQRALKLRPDWPQVQQQLAQLQ